MIGIPHLQHEHPTYVYEPSEADKGRVAAIEKEIDDAVARGYLADEPRDDYVAVRVQERKTAYVSPAFELRYRRLLDELSEVDRRGMRQQRLGEAEHFHMNNGRGWRLPDGTRLEYYRRKDGALIRAATKADGTVRRWVIGWADVSQSRQYARYWRDE
jgi:hypothetical protein